MTRRILIVDDDQSIGLLLSYQLREAGFEASYQPDPQRALQQITSEQPDLLLLDAIMPSINGWELCGQIRRSFALPIIMVTARDDDSDVISGLRAGADDYVVKPFSTPQLLARIEAVLRRSNSQAAQRGGTATAAPATPITTKLSPSDLEARQATRSPEARPSPREQAPAPGRRMPASIDPCSVPAPAPSSDEAPNSHRSLGSYLRSRRVGRGVSLYQAERECRIRWEYLQAIELNNHGFMPPNELRQALRSYATYLEADISPWVRQRRPKTSLVSSAPFIALALTLVFVLVLSAYLL